MNTERILITIAVSALCTFFLRALAVSGFRRITEDAGLAGPTWKNTSLSDHGSADRLLFERCGK